MELKYVKGDLFQLAPKDAFLAHACNCQGSWGAGIAHTFKEKYYEDYLEYKEDCDIANHNDYSIAGNALFTKNRIICLLVSDSYGKYVDSPERILLHTREALDDLVRGLPDNAVVYSPKFNSGLFRVPWAKTEYLLKEFLKERPDVKWTVVEWTA